MRKEDKKFLLFLVTFCIILIIEFFFWVERGKKLDNVAEQLETMEESTEEPTVTIIPIESPKTEKPQMTIEEEPTKEETPPDLDIPLEDEYKTFIYEQCGYDDDLYCLAISVVKCESDFDLYAVSDDGHDFGLFQIRDTYHDEFAEEFNVSDPKEPHDNIIVGVGLLKKYIAKHEYKNLALMCYNNGPDGAKEKWNDGIYSTNYTVKVLAKYQEYLEQAGL